jgi:hypothetical protein
MTCYQIKDWDSYFENDRSRNYDRCGFVCVPNKQHGMGFSRVMAEPDGAAIYGIFAMIIGACSQQKRPRNGWLTDNGLPPHVALTARSRSTNSQPPIGQPWDASDLAIKFRRPVTEINRAIEVLSNPKIGWIVVHTDETLKTIEKPNKTEEVTPNSPATHVPLTSDSPGKERKGKEEKGMEHKDSPSNPPSEKLEEPQAAPAETHDKAFEMFWQAYPKKVGKLAALKSFDKAVAKNFEKPNQAARIQFAYLLAEKAKAQSETLDWLKEDGKFIPHPATWLNQGRWMDETKKPEDRYEGAFK